MKQLPLCIAVLIAFSMSAQEYPSFQSQFPVKWKTKIGGTTFKTNFVLHDGLLIVGSNGNHYRDWRLDYGNGVYFIDPANGKIMHRAAHEGYGDMDVNGVAAHKSRVYFGNDNDEFFCYDTCGRLIWRVPVSGDVEAEPVLLDINCDNMPEVIFATEKGEVAALNAKDGSTLWSFKIKDFSGWNKTDNRFLFKVGAHFSNGSGSVVKPAIAELSGDEVPDLIYNCRDQFTYAINGENGKVLWKFNHGEMGYVTGIPFTLPGNEKEIYTLQYKLNEKNQGSLHFVCLNTVGKVKRIYRPSWNYAYNYVPVYENHKFISVARDTVVELDLTTGDLQKAPLISTIVNSYGYRYNYSASITARPQLFDFLKSGDKQLMVIGEDGVVQLLNKETFERLRTLQLPAGTETTPLVGDIDDDGKLEMLVGCYDGYLYCFDLRTSAKGFIAELK